MHSQLGIYSNLLIVNAVRRTQTGDLIVRLRTKHQNTSINDRKLIGANGPCSKTSPWNLLDILEYTHTHTHTLM